MKRFANFVNLYRGVSLNLRRISSIAAIAEFKSSTHPKPHLYNSNSTHLVNLHTILQICAKNRQVMEGKACHGHVVTLGLQSDTLTLNVLINFYSKCGLIDCARHVFEEMSERTIVSWNTIIGTYTQNGNDEEALILFKNMRNSGTLFSEFTVSSVLCACATKFAVFECKQLHAFALKTAMDSNVFVGTALLDVYAKCGFVMEASRVFENMGEKSEVTWSSMLAGYVQNEMYEDALKLFKKSQVMGLEHNKFSISSVLSACAGLATLIEGKQVHSVLSKAGFNLNIFVASSLIDFYAKCGNIKDAYTVFLAVEDRNIVLWNVMICGFSKHACSFEVMILFEKMQQTGICPNELTYISVLSVCSHIGLVEEGRIYFDLMIKQHNITPNVFHYSCMVDIIGRVGLVFEAMDTIQNMPSSFEATASMWGSLLSSCRIHKNLELAETAAKKLFEMEPSNAGNHVLLSNIYALNKKWDEVAKSRQLLKTSEATKEKGRSWIEIKDNVHTFMVGDINHPRISEIYSKLEDLMKELKRVGYIVVIEHELHNVEEKWKHELLRHHSEKLALTFGLMCLPSDAPIRIMKNLRICGDCHSFMKFASSIKRREIIVRDTNRFHHFTDGCCSCKDFW